MGKRIGGGSRLLSSHLRRSAFALYLHLALDLPSTACSAYDEHSEYGRGEHAEHGENPHSNAQRAHDGDRSPNSSSTPQHHRSEHGEYRWNGLHECSASTKWNADREHAEHAPAS